VLPFHGQHAFALSTAMSNWSVAFSAGGDGGSNAQMKAPWTDTGLRELIGLSLLSVGGCSLALGQGDLLFVALFGAASIVAITETIRRLR
jgi:hypothetical protein